MAGRHDGDAQVDVAAFVLHTEAAVLGNAAFRNVQIAEHFDARKHGGMPFLGDRLHGVLEDAVNAVLNGDFGITCFDVNVTGAALKGGENNGFDETDNGAGGA